MPYANKGKQDEYCKNYQKEHYARLNLLMPPGDADFIRRAADAAGLSYSQYVIAAVREKVLRDALRDD